MENKFAKYALGNAIGSIIVTLFLGIFGMLFAALAIGLAIKALMDFKKEPAIGGKGHAIAALIISGCTILLFGLIMVLATVFLLSGGMGY